MKIYDLHCDVLYKLAKAESPISFTDSSLLQANKERLEAGKVVLQLFAVFVSEGFPKEQQFMEAVRQIEFFHTEIVGKHDDIVAIYKWEQLETLQEGQIGAVLSLEGLDMIDRDIEKLKLLLSHGVKLVGLTWNGANAVADGAAGESGTGLTSFGEEVVTLLNEQNIIIDVSHLSEKSFWDVLPKAKWLMASHSNARAICDSNRNLTDQQLKGLIERDSPIHIVYYPQFINNSEKYVDMSDLVRHVDHIASLGGEHLIGLGSDFDGISEFVTGLEDASKTQSLVRHLLKDYTTEQVQGFTSRNFGRFAAEISKEE
ncbi:dipeptidase [Psychrobacillus lasiicapitis]|uniref:Membrane dipeptidase n=1 Tax=Psychrobacillus lasiicapitis TaxID=1636719 RepID=A0A544T564_9BACI|nr:dipeptidase [Psychrobacillus lasiicapitis]TQR12577.1 membrane dipeptidase [Psychrobacillus lasiicapitis]GGA39264.1 dipeptidase [Psychrobacillus lasiicapitis]